MKEKTEILAPAGSMDSLKAAVAAGADAVYTGGAMFGARAYADNFDEDHLLKAIDYIHLHGRKLYLTVNTLLKEKEIEDSLYDYLLPYYRRGLDAVIVQDVGALRFIRQNFPELPIHASTQMTVTGVEGAKLLEEAGAERVVTARELQLHEVRRIAEETGLQIESFVHGALCYCYSGQCLFSSFLGGRSGNRGRCAQPCRLPYRAEGEHKEACLLSLKDICTLELIPELVEAGIDSFKIEGRMKKPEYVAGVTAMYRKYTDLYLRLKKEAPGRAQACVYAKERFRVEESDLEMLGDLYNRGGFHSGYYHRKNGREMVSLARSNHAGIAAVRLDKKQGKYWCGKALTKLHPQDILELPLQRGQERAENYTCGTGTEKGQTVRLTLPGRYDFKPGTVLWRTRNQQLINRLREEYVDKKIKEKLNGKFILSPGDSATLTISCGDTEVTVQGETAREAVNQPMDADRIRKQLTKTGNTEFEFEHLEIQISGSPFLPVQSLNEIRREALGRIEQAIAAGYRRECKAARTTVPHAAAQADGQPQTGFCASAESEIQIEVLLKSKLIRRIYADTSIPGIWEEGRAKRLVLAAHRADKELYLAMPYILREASAKRYEERWELIQEAGLDGMLVRNHESVRFLEDRGFAKPVVTDYNLYQFNRYAKEFWKDRGITRLTAPPELNAGELLSLGISDSELPAYGYLPMMISAGCVKKTLGLCRGESGLTRITDRYRKDFTVKNYCGDCYNIIYNYAPLYLGDKLSEVMALHPQAIRLAFTLEGREETGRILELFEGALEGRTAAFTGGEFTRGHFKRGIK